jgi:hypothetical protein
LAVTDAKKECEEVVTKTAAISFRIGTSRFKKKKKKGEIFESRVMSASMLHTNTHPCLT